MEQATFKTDQLDPLKAQFDKNLFTILYVTRDSGGCGFYRCFQPAVYLRRMKLFNTIVDFKNTTPEHINQADLIVFQEAGTPQALEAMSFAKSIGKPVVLEIDDFVHFVSPHNTAGYGSWNPSTLFIHRFDQMCRHADAMTVSTPQLAREYFVFNPNIYVLPNFLDKDKWDQPLTKKNDGIIRIGWAGGNAHGDDLKMISKVIEKIVRDYKGKVKFETMGMMKPELGGTFNGLEEYNHVCPKCDYQGEYVLRSGEHLENYPIVLASYGWDIALAPIVNGSFNSAKSDLKLKEYSALGIPTVASRVTPYIEAQKNGCDVLLAETFKEWYNNIDELIKNTEKRKKMADNNRQWMENYWIQERIKDYAETYKQIIEKNNKNNQPKL